jgi:hypothetical protein
MKENKRLITSEGAMDAAAPITVFIDVDFRGRDYAEAVALVLQIKGEVDDSDDPIEPVEVIIE